MKSLFGTDGIRGTANEDPLTADFLSTLSETIGTHWKRRESYNRVLLGHDGRLSHDLLISAIAAGFMSAGLDPQLLGLCSTPSLSFLCREQDVAGGVMVSASHNPFEDNGIKLFTKSGEKLTPEEENQIEGLLDRKEAVRRTGSKIGRSMERENWLSHYVQEIADRGMEFPGHVVLDCANGGTSRLGPAVLKRCAREATIINNQPDGTNINDEAGSLHPDVIAEAVRDRGADLGFALDGDGDRVVAVDENGTLADGDQILYLLAKYYEKEGDLDGEGIVVTSMSNLGLRLILEENELAYEITDVGDRFVYSRMKEVDWRLGGEQSGHVIDRRWLPTGDGLNTMVSVMNALVATAKPLSYWSEQVERYPQILHNIDVEEKPPLETLPRTRSQIEEVENELGREGRVLVRYSGTEPVARIMLEGRQRERLQKLAAGIGEIMKEEIHEDQEETI